MHTFLLIDPVEGRRAILKHFFEPECRVIDYRTVSEAARPPIGNVTAVFIAWPEAVPTASDRDIKPSWSCESVAFLTADGLVPEDAGTWSAQAFPRAQLAAMRCPDGYINANVVRRMRNWVNELDAARIAAAVSPLPHARSPERVESDYSVPAPTPDQNDAVRVPPSSGNEFADEMLLDGYKKLRELARTNWTQVLLAEREFTGELFIVKRHRLQNDQARAMKKAIALHTKPEANRFMVPIHHVKTCSEEQYMVVVDCLDDSVRGRLIDRNLYHPKTFQRWLDVHLAQRFLPNQKRPEALEHLLAILDVLDFFHRNQLVMNDVKPANFGFYEDRLVAVDYGGITFLGHPPHEATPGYGPPPNEPRKGIPAEDVFAVVQMMGQALYAWPLELLQPDRIESDAKDYLAGVNIFDMHAWQLLVKGLHPTPGVRFQDGPSMKAAVARLKKMLK
jgi:hypothetical protein